MPEQQPLGGYTMREVYRLVESLRRELRAEVISVRDHIAKHQEDHRAEAERRGAILRWFVTTLVALLAVAVGLLAALL